MKIDLKGDEAIIIFSAEGFRCLLPEGEPSEHVMLASHLFDQLTKQFSGETTVIPTMNDDGETLQ